MYIARDDGLNIIEDHKASIDHQALYERLMSCACNSRGKGNTPFLAQMLASWMCGQGALPRFMGLDEETFKAMISGSFAQFKNAGLQTRCDIEPDRANELEDVKTLLLDHRSHQSDEELWIAQIVATGSMGSDHLWSDLGLFARKSLGEMLLYNFRPLAEQNTNNMRWKKFFYRQLCAKEGFVLCRSPSCETCSEYTVCFAPEGA
ncbi:nitrogen fixation protein NifQ [uncultured Cohaesibacter sp.]|uniref:nitrogen fixation protein NifQ n=1 Tax=uncultured Cohaesibacter sp. TaxID=1002546 RepID=UPI00374A6844